MTTTGPEGPGDALPFVSVIIPVYNAASTLPALLASLEQLDYPRDRREFLIVDNGSTDATPDILRGFAVIVLEERQHRGSYAARNRALAQARGDVFAFTDADCAVTPSWLREGVKALGSADIAAGRVDFRSSARPSAAELYDSLHHMNQDLFIRKYSGAATANLFVRAGLFRLLGPFRADVRSGGDMMWTRAASAAGYRLVYAPDAVVAHPARGLGELLRKGFRLGTGIYRMHRQRGIRTGSILYEVVRGFFPPRPGPLGETVRERGSAEHRRRIFSLWLVGYAYRAVRGAGVFSALLRETTSTRTPGSSPAGSRTGVG